MLRRLRSSRLARPLLALFVVALLVTGWAAERTRDSTDPRTHSRLPSNLSLEELAGCSLFTNLEERERRLLRMRRHEGRESELRPTERPAEIRWAESLGAAIERARREDKPIVVFTFVRENGDPLCDV